MAVETCGAAASGRNVVSLIRCGVFPNVVQEAADSSDRAAHGFSYLPVQKPPFTQLSGAVAPLAGPGLVVVTRLRHDVADGPL